MTPITSHLRRALLAAAAAVGIAAQADAGSLNAPLGIAVDQLGNLYVANAGANNVTVYDRSYAQVGTISGHMNVPTSVAVDWNYVYVTNEAGNNVTFYPLYGQPSTYFTISDPALTMPTAAFVDQLGAVWVLDAYGNTHIYTDGTPLRTLPAQVPPAQAFTLANNNLHLWGGATGVAGSSGYATGSAIDILTGRTTQLRSGNTLPIGAVAFAASDAASNEYLTDPVDQIIAVLTPGQPAPTPILSLPYAPQGIALDLTAQRMYVSDLDGNKVHVYSLKAPYKLLHVIQ